MLTECGAVRSETLVASVPTGRSTADPLEALALRVADRLGLSTVTGLFARRKRESTRASVAQARARIARDEYTVVRGVAARVDGKNVLLLDDTVTTGHTLAALSILLRQWGTRRVLPVALDRTASPRLLQRIDSRAPDHCPHVGDGVATDRFR
jgi:predicted amidophosphoribosyltransferase